MRMVWISLTAFVCLTMLSVVVPGLFIARLAPEHLVTYASWSAFGLCGTAFAIWLFVRLALPRLRAWLEEGNENRTEH